MRFPIQRFSVFLLFLCLGFQTWSATPRKRVAVVLSGGGAKGMAHIGALKVLERAGIPVDIITGTSMGSIVGGLYSCGWNASQLDSMVRQQDWPFLLSDKGEYYSQNLIGRERQNTYVLSKTLTLGKKKVAEAGGIIQGKNLAKLFDHLTAGYNDSISFDSLPIPFACVATNIVDNTEYVFHSGRLAEAMRSSMSIPAAFAPVRKGEMVLVDGGLRNNYPADIAKAMGADVIIGVTVQGKPKTADDLTNGASILGQIVDVNCKNKYEDNLALTDIPIRVNTEGYSAASFTPVAIDTLIRRGEEEAMRHWDELMALRKSLGIGEDSVPPLHTPHAEALAPIDFTNSNAPNRPDHDMVTGRLGVRFDTEEMVALQVNGTYAMAKYPVDLEATVRLGRNMMGNVTARWMSSNHLEFSLAYTLRHNKIDIYNQGENDFSITYNHHQASFSLMNISVRNLTMDLSTRWDYYNYHQVLVASTLGHSGFKVSDDHYFSYHANLHYNSENDWNFPSRGARFLAEYAYFTDNFIKYKDHAGFSELSASWQMSFPLSRHLTLQPLLYGRMLFGSDIPFIRQNLIGGQWFGHDVGHQMPFIGVHHIEMTDPHFLACQLKLQEQLTTNNFLMLKVVSGQHADALEHLLKHAPMLGVQLAYYYRTLLGPVGASIGYSNHTDEFNFFVNLGFEF